MAVNKRIFYACQAVGIQNNGKTAAISPGSGPEGNWLNNEMVHGLQSVGITTNFSLEQAFELGQIEIYENIEGTPDIEVSMEKVLDGANLMYHLATTGVKYGTSSGLANRSKQQCQVILGIFKDGDNFVGGTNNNNSQTEVYMSGLYVSNVSYTLGVDGSFTESISLVGNNKEWKTAGASRRMTAAAVNAFDGVDEPIGLGSAAKPSGGINQKEDFMVSGSILPLSVEGVFRNGYNNGTNVHIQSVSVSTDFSREDIFELGQKTPYDRPATFPIEVTCDIEAIAVSGDLVEASEFGDQSLWTTTASGNNTQNETIFFYTRNGLGLDLGSKNRLSSVSYGGGDAGGGNATVTYSYSNFNDLDVQMNKRTRMGTEVLKNGDGKDAGDHGFPFAAL